MFRKIYALFLSILVLSLSGLFSFGVLAATPTRAFEDFNDATYLSQNNLLRPDTMYSVNTVPADLGVTASRETGAFGKLGTDASLKISTNSSVANNVEFQGYLVADSVANTIAANDTLVITADIATTVKGNAGTKGILTKLNNAWGAGGASMAVDFKADGYIYSYGVKTVSYDISKWYRVAVVLKGNTATFDFYVNGIKVVNGGALGVTLTTLTAVRLSLKTALNAVTDLYMDNTEIYSGTFRDVSRTDIASNLLEKSITSSGFVFKKNIKVADFLAGIIKPTAGATVSLFKSNGITPVVSGDLGVDYIISVTSEDGLNISNYKILSNVFFDSEFDNTIIQNATPSGFSTLVNPSTTSLSFAGAYGVGGKLTDNQSAKIKAVSSVQANKNLYFEKNFDEGIISYPANSKVSLEYSIFSADYNCNRQLQIQTNTADWTNTAGIVLNNSADITEVASPYAILGTYSIGAWHRVAIVFTLGTTSYDVYFDGVKLRTLNATSQINSIRDIRFSFISNDSVESETYIDDITIYGEEFDNQAFLNNVEIKSNQLNIDYDNNVITSDEIEMQCSEFINSIEIPIGAIASLYLSDKIIPATGQIATGMYYIVRSISGINHEFVVSNLSARISSPISGAKLRPNTPFWFSVDVNDESKVLNLEIKLDNEIVANITSPPFSYEISGITEGGHTISATITGPNGIMINAGSVSIICSPNIFPTISSDLEDETKLNYGQPLTINVTADDEDSGVNFIRLYVDGKGMGEYYMPPFTYYLDNLTIGRHIIRIEAEDSEGAVSFVEKNITVLEMKNGLLAQFEMSDLSNFSAVSLGSFGYGVENTDDIHKMSGYISSTGKIVGGLNGYLNTSTINSILTSSNTIEYEFKYTGATTHKFALAQMRLKTGSFNDAVSIVDGRFVDTASGDLGVLAESGKWYKFSYSYDLVEKKDSYVITDSLGNIVVTKQNRAMTNSGEIDHLRITVYGKEDVESKLYFDNYKLYSRGVLPYLNSVSYTDANSIEVIDSKNVSIFAKELLVGMVGNVMPTKINAKTIELLACDQKVLVGDIKYNTANKRIVISLKAPLISATDYFIKIVEDITDDTGTNIPKGSTISFRTEAKSFDISESKFTCFGSTVYAGKDAYNREVAFSAKAVNNTSNTKQIAIALVVYKDNIMMGISIKQFTINPNSYQKVYTDDVLVPLGGFAEGYILDNQNSLGALKLVHKLN